MLFLEIMLEYLGATTIVLYHINIITLHILY